MPYHGWFHTWWGLPPLSLFSSKPSILAMRQGILFADGSRSSVWRIVAHRLLIQEEKTPFFHQITNSYSLIPHSSFKKTEPKALNLCQSVLICGLKNLSMLWVFFVHRLSQIITDVITNKLIWINKVRKIILLVCRIRIYSYLCTQKYDKSYADGYRNSD